MKYSLRVITDEQVSSSQLRLVISMGAITVNLMSSSCPMMMQLMLLAAILQLRHNFQFSPSIKICLPLNK